VPTKLDSSLLALDVDGAVRATTITVGNQHTIQFTFNVFTILIDIHFSIDTTWRLKYLKGLLSQPSEKSLAKDSLHTEKNKAFDLLDALRSVVVAFEIYFINIVFYVISRSGGILLNATDLHVVLATTHVFDKVRKKQVDLFLIHTSPSVPIDFIAYCLSW
jgi:hypothetical protein